LFTAKKCQVNFTSWTVKSNMICCY